MLWNETNNFWIVPSSDEDQIMMLAREQEWAEAYLAEHPGDELGTFYFNLIRQELCDAEAFH